jgi:hypothetical protein
MIGVTTDRILFVAQQALGSTTFENVPQGL